MKPFISQMFRVGGLDVITLFHNPSIAASTRALTILKQASAHASSTSTEDQASDHTHQNKVQRSEFQLDVTEDPPTPDQVKSILEFVGNGKVGSVVQGANSVSDAVSKLKNDQKAFQRPVTVDWNAGRAVVGDDESQILALVNQQPGVNDAH